jgi:hypothetical protein
MTVRNSQLKGFNSISSHHYLPLGDVEAFFLAKLLKNDDGSVCQAPYHQWYKLHCLQILFKVVVETHFSHSIPYFHYNNEPREYENYFFMKFLTSKDIHDKSFAPYNKN